MTEPQEIEPFIVIRASSDSAEIGLWKLTDERRAVALFLDRESAEKYVNLAALSNEWRAFKPEKQKFLSLLESARAGGIELVVLEPNAESAQRVWSIEQLLAAAGE